MSHDDIEDSEWVARRAWWGRRLGRLRPELEPLPDQLGRLRGVTWALTLVALGIGSIIFGILTAFGSPTVGLAVGLIVFGPVVIGAWLEDWTLHRRAAAYERELAGRSRGMGRGGPEDDGGSPRSVGGI